MSRGQIISIEFVIALSAFFFAILVLIYTWQQISIQSQQQGLSNDIERLVESFSIAMVSHPGEPVHWYNVTYANISSVGLTTGFGVLSMDRVFALNNYDATAISPKLGIAGAGYSYYVDVFDNQTLVFSYGNQPVASADYIGVREYYMWNGSRTLLLQFGVWHNE